MKNDTFIKRGTLGLIALFIIFSVSTFAVAEKTEKTSDNSWYHYLGKGVGENDGFTTGTSIKTGSPKEKKPKDKSEDPAPAPDEPAPGETEPALDEPGSGDVGTMGVTPPLFMIDDYNDGDWTRNSQGFESGIGSGLGGSIFWSEERLYQWVDENNRYKLLIYNYGGEGYAYYYSKVWDDVTLLDASSYNYLSFRLKGEAGGEDFHIAFQHSTPLFPGDWRPETPLQKLSSFGVTVTTEWQEVNIPLSAFEGGYMGLNRSEMRAVVINFSSGITPIAGVIYIDNMHFSKYGYAQSKPESIGSVSIRRDTDELYVDNQPFTIKGVGYQPTPIGSGPPSATNPWTYPDDSDIFERDFQLLEEMGCNTIRTWSLPPSPWPLYPGIPYNNLMDKAEEHGIKVIAAFWMDQATQYDELSPAEIDVIKNGFRDFVNAYKDHPALLAWAIGNENNIHMAPNNPYPTPEDYRRLYEAYYKLCNELAEVAYSIEGDSYHPVMIVNGHLHWIGIAGGYAEDPQLDHIDAWGVNAYHKDFNNIDFGGFTGNFFECYRELSKKPLIITEYGADAYGTESINPIVGKEDNASRQAQALWDARNTYNILYDSPFYCLGGCVMTYSDEWWKHNEDWWDDFTKEVYAFIHNPGPAAPWGNRLPDGYANEEYWGIVQIALDGTWDVPDDLDDVKPRPVYNKLKTLFNVTRILNPGESIQTAIDEALPGDVLLLKPGTYNYGFYIYKDLTIAALDPMNTIINLGIHNITLANFQANITLEGLTITDYQGQLVYGKEAAIMNRAQLTLRDCRIVGNRSIRASAIYDGGGYTKLHIENTLIADNENLAGGIGAYGYRDQNNDTHCGTIYLDGYCDLSIENSTIADNKNYSASPITIYTVYGTTAEVDVYYGAILRKISENISLKNSIMWGNGRWVGSTHTAVEDFYHRYSSQEDTTVTYSNIQSGAPYAPAGKLVYEDNIEPPEDPQFINPVSDDFTPQNTNCDEMGSRFPRF